MSTLTQQTELPQAIESFMEARTADALFVVDPSYQIVHWDAQAESLTGLLAEEMAGKPCYEVVQGECDEGVSFSAHLSSVMRLAQEGKSAPSCDMRIFTRSRGRRWINVSTLSVETDEGPYLVHLMRDTQKAYETLMAKELIRIASKKEGPAHERREYPPVLMPRQLEVLKLLSEGRNAKEIGRKLYLSQATVRNHIRSLLQALGAHSQMEALAKAHNMGLLSMRSG
ncbi:MAG: PAS domain-containing protein [Rubrobacter sp.]|nr:PAS domain-containing protein [Rubrobacter sp.]